MSPLLSTPAGSTVTYLSNTWPWSLHELSSGDMTFWNDLLSALAQFSLFSSTTVVTPSTIPDVGINFNSTALPSSTAAASPSMVTTLYSFQTTLQSFNSSNKSHGNDTESIIQSINQTASQYESLSVNNKTSGGGGSGANDVVVAVDDTSNTRRRSNASGSGVMQENNRMMNITTAASSPMSTTATTMTSITTTSSMNETLSIYGTTNNTSNLTSDGVLNNLVDCNDFTEQKLLNIVICSIGDVNNLINGSSTDNSTFNDTLIRNISDDTNFYNQSYNGTEVSGNELNSTGHTESTLAETAIYFIQVITTAVVLGIIILATVIGKFNY